MSPEALSSWHWNDYAFLAFCFLLIFGCGVMFARDLFFELGRLEAYREQEKRRKLRQWEDIP